MNKTFILKSGYKDQIFLNGKQEQYKLYCFDLIDQHGIRITQNIRILESLTIDEKENKINKHLDKLIKSYIETKNKNIHLYK